MSNLSPIKKKEEHVQIRSRRIEKSERKKLSSKPILEPMVCQPIVVDDVDSDTEDEAITRLKAGCQNQKVQESPQISPFKEPIEDKVSKRQVRNVEAHKTEVTREMR